MEIRKGKIARILGSGFAETFIDEFIKYSRSGLNVNSEKSLISIYRIGKTGSRWANFFKSLHFLILARVYTLYHCNFIEHFILKS